MRITPVIRRAIGLLGLSNQGLEELVKKELERNPLIQEVEGNKNFYCQLEFIFAAPITNSFDAEIKRNGSVKINNNNIPKIQIGPLIDCKDRDVRYTRQLNSARWLLGGIRRRGKILKDVLEKAARCQKEYLHKGSEYIKPLTIKEVAGGLKLNPSTVSRVVSNKYILTPWGTLKLRDLFRRPVNNNGSKTITKEYLKEVIGKMIGRNALRDEEVKDLLDKKGIKVSRRTVSQYRAMLGVPAYRRGTRDEGRRMMDEGRGTKNSPRRWL